MPVLFPNALSVVSNETDGGVEDAGPLTVATVTQQLHGPTGHEHRGDAR